MNKWRRGKRAWIVGGIRQGVEEGSVCKLMYFYTCGCLYRLCMPGMWINAVQYFKKPFNLENLINLGPRYCNDVVLLFGSECACCTGMTC